MKDPKEFCEELEALMIKYEVDQSISIFPMEGMTRICSYSLRKEEEPKMAEVFNKFAEIIGKIDTETISAVTDILEVMFKEQESQEESISQVTWETIAKQNAEELLSEEDYEKLENAQILKLAAIEANEWERAATHREVELSILKKVMEIVELKDPRTDNPDC
jgi:hypothetical protein